jgi:hypothetical protein
LAIGNKGEDMAHAGRRLTGGGMARKLVLRNGWVELTGGADAA